MLISLFQNKQQTKINQTNPRHVIYICICLSPPGVDFPFPLKLFRHFSYVGRSSRFSCQQSRMILCLICRLCLQIRTKGFMRCCWWSIVKEGFLILKVYRSWIMTTWVTKEMYNKLISRIQIHNQELTKHYHCVVVLAFCGPVEVVVLPFAH